MVIYLGGYLPGNYGLVKLRQKFNIFQIQNKQLIDQHGRFKCRFPGCKQTYQFNGKHKQEHETKEHGLPPSSKLDRRKQTTDYDDMYNYQCSLMEYLMLIRNFKDAISEGLIIVISNGGYA